MRRRLALVTLAVTSLVVLAFLVPLAILVRNQAETRALRQAERNAESIAAALAVAGTSDPTAEIDETLARAMVTAFGNPDGVSVVFPGRVTVGAPLTGDTNIEQAERGAAFIARTTNGAEVLVPVLSPAGPGEADPVVIVRAFVPNQELSSGVAVAWLMLGAVGLFLVIVAVVAADRLGRSVVRPVTELSAAARRLGDGDLDTRVDPAGPAEIAGVGEAFNHLAGRLGSLLEQERESVADLSHRLRTPLTALRLQAETLQDPIESKALLHDIDQVERSVSRLIADARRPSQSDTAQCDLGPVTMHRAAFWQVLAEEQGRASTVEIRDEPLVVGLDADELGALVDTLLENVFAHTPNGVAYRVLVERDDGVARLVVEDDGPGFPQDRSVLARGASGGGSTGLGLDIVSRAAERCGGGLEVGSRPGGGAHVEATFALVED